jgi:hypothetical protein
MPQAKRSRPQTWVRGVDAHEANLIGISELSGGGHWSRQIDVSLMLS